MSNQNLELELIESSMPFPSVSITGELRNGLIIDQPKICKKCKHKECKDFRDSEGDSIKHVECTRGMSVIVFPFSSGCLVANGLIEMTLNRKASPTLKKQNRTQKVNYETAVRWWTSANSTASIVNTALERRVRESIQGLHDIGTAVGLVRSCADHIIRGYPGSSDYERIEAAPDDMKALFKSVLLLGRHLEMSSIISNPEAASFGQKKPTPIYKVFDLMRNLFEQVAHNDQGKHIALHGSSFKTPITYHSFQTLALVLVDNAVKYCEPGDWVNINVNDVNEGVKVSIENRGPLVKEEYRNLIFDKGFRTPLASKMQASGRGLGLYIASIIAKIHDFQLEYVPLLSGTSSDRKYGTNAFRFTVPE